MARQVVPLQVFIPLPKEFQVLKGQVDRLDMIEGVLALLGVMVLAQGLGGDEEIVPHAVEIKPRMADQQSGDVEQEIFAFLGGGSERAQLAVTAAHVAELRRNVEQMDGFGELHRVRVMERMKSSSLRCCIHNVCAGDTHTLRLLQKVS